MRLFNWRRQAVLNAMPLVKPDQVRTPWHEFWRRFRRQHMAMTAALFVILLIVVAIFARWIAPYDAENYFDYDNLNNGPSLQHWFGVDSLGRDIFSRVLVGAQISLAAGVFAVFIGAAIGTLLGLLAGYYEGWWDRLIMRICDVLFAFPGILLAIAVVAVLGSGIANVIIAVAIFSIPAFARLVRGSVLAEREQEFVTAAKALGVKEFGIIFRHILPNIITVIIVNATLDFATCMLTESSLSFIGFGVAEPNATWGNMLNGARTGRSLRTTGGGGCSRPSRWASAPSASTAWATACVMPSTQIEREVSAVSLLEVKNLHTYFKTKKGIVKAVNDVTYSLDAGKTLGIVGNPALAKVFLP